MKVALVYDRVNKWGGAERVLLALNKIFPKADLYTSVYDAQNAKWANIFSVKTSFLQKIAFLRSKHELLAFLMPFCFESFNFDKYDLVISVTSESAKGIITKPHTRHLCYCLTPTRYLWSGFNDYFNNYLFRFFALPLIKYLKKWDMLASVRPDKFIAISNEVKVRISNYYNRKSIVIFPPIDILLKNVVKPKEKDYFLVVSRLVKYKRIDIAIKAFNDLGLPLIIIGSGGQEENLKSIAKSNIKFVKNVSDNELYGYYANSRTLIFPGNEDFGLVMAEAQFFGKPVIAFKAGGALDIVKEGVTGEFFDQQEFESLKKVLEKFDHKLYNERNCRINAERFNFLNFKKQILKVVNEDDNL